MPIAAKGVTPLLEVFDMRRSVAFYRDVLGCEVVQQWAPDGHLYWAMLKLGGATLMLNARYEADARPAEPDAARVAGHADTELLFDCGDVDEAYRHLPAAGVDVTEPAVTHYGMRSVWVTDPDGFRLSSKHRDAEPSAAAPGAGGRDNVAAYATGMAACPCRCELSSSSAGSREPSSTCTCSASSSARVW